MARAGMAAVVHYALQEGAVELREVPTPAELAEDEVLLAPQAVGVCGSEIHQYHNTQSWSVRVPVILGHEFCGVVVQVGKGARRFREGDRVVSETAARICGQCIYCRSGDYNLCRERLGFGYGVDGAMAEFVKVQARCLHHLPDSVSFEKAAITEPCCVAYNATCVKTRVQPGDSVLVLGPGPIGLLCLALAKLSGAGWVGVVGLKQDELRLAVARALGADRIVIGEEEDPLEVVHSLGDGLGVDVVIDATGVSQTLRVGLAAVRPNGQITKVGWGPQPLDFSLDALVQKAARIQGSFSHNYPIWERVIGLLAAGKLDPWPLVGRVEPLEGWRICFEEMATGKIVKAILNPGGSKGPRGADILKRGSLMKTQDSQRLCLAGQVAVVTGSAQGIGAGIAKKLAEHGARVVVHGREREKETAEKILAAIQELGGEGLVALGDLQDEARCRQLIRQAIERFGRLDILVNNAGVVHRGNIEDTSVALWDEILAVNLRAPFILCQEAVQHMKERRSGCIVNIGSVNAHVGERKILAYSASKGGLMTFTKNLANYLTKYQIRVNQINPGWVLTEGEHYVESVVEGKGENWLEDALKTRPFGRMLYPEEIARAVLFFATNELLTGAVLDYEQAVIGAPRDL